MHTLTLRPLATVVLASLFATSLAAQSLYWNPTGSTSTQQGSGTIDTSTALWNTSATPSATLTAWSDGSAAIFGGTGGTITANNLSLATGNVTFEASTFSTPGYTLQGDLTLQITGNLILQNYGRLTVSDSLAINADLAIYNGTLTMNGGAFQTTANGYIGINSSSQNGRLNIQNGGSANFQHFSVATLVGSYGFVTVEDAGSALTITGNAYFGQEGNYGSLTVRNGASATVNNLTIGYASSAGGNVTVSGAGSTLTVSDQLYVGRDGSGSLTVTNGGTVVWGAGTNALNLGKGSTLRIGEGNGAAGTFQVAGITSTQTIATATVSFGHGDAALHFSTPLSGNLRVEHVGSGTTTLGGYNVHTGGTLISAGTLALGNYNALGSGPLTLEYGTLDLDGFSQYHGADSTATFTLAGDAFIDFSGGGNTLAFANSSALEWWGTLTILGFTEGDSFRVGTDATGLTAAQLMMIHIDGFYAQIDASGYLSASASAIPEPSTYAALAGLGALGLVIVRRRQRQRASAHANRVV